MRTIWDILPGMTYKGKTVQNVQRGGMDASTVLLTFSDGTSMSVDASKVIN